MIDKDLVQHIARLARLDLSDNEQDKIQKELSSILDYIAQLNEVDVKDVDLQKIKTDLENVLREDKVLAEKKEVIENILFQLPKREGNYIKVKEILSK